jgi:hypothetical protein
VDEPRYLDPDEPPATKRPRNGRGRFVALPATAMRDAEAARMRAEGYRLREICVALGFGSEGAAHDAANRAIRALRTVGAEAAKKAALARLEEMYAAAADVLRTRHYVVSHGHLVYIGGKAAVDEKGNVHWAGGTPLEDDAPVLNALGIMLRIEHQKALIEGTFAPVKARVEVSRVDGVDQAIRDLVEAMDREPAD